jgi:enoyl-CoA hydratase
MNTTIDAQPPTMTVSGTVARIALRRPKHANRIETPDLDALVEFFAELKHSKQIRAVILQSEGRYFSAGYDIGQVAEIAVAQPDGPIDNPFEALVEGLESLPQVTIARLHGGVYGGSTDLALACDFRVGTPATEMFMPAAALGLLYYPSGIKRFVSRLGLNEAKRLFLLGEKTHADDMLRIGFLTDLVADGELDKRVDALAQRVATLAPLAVSETKRAMNALGRDEFDLADFKDCEARILRSSDLREGLTAWKEKRPATFSGQ